MALAFCESPILGTRRVAVPVRPPIGSAPARLVSGISSASVRKTHDNAATVTTLPLRPLFCLRVCLIIDSPSVLITLVLIDSKSAGGQGQRWDGKYQPCYREGKHL